MQTTFSQPEFATHRREMAVNRRDELLIEFCERHKLCIRRLATWRMLPPDGQVAGYINGFPQSYGILRATGNGLCIIERQDGTLFEGHLDWFIRSREAAEKSLHKKPDSDNGSEKPAKARRSRLTAEQQALLAQICE
jgi:hypothetical protein